MIASFKLIGRVSIRTMNIDVITRLDNRKTIVKTTLEHIYEQRLEVEANAEWMDQCAQQRRRVLLAELNGWYDSKLRRIDKLISQIATRQRLDRSGESALVRCSPKMHKARNR